MIDVPHTVRAMCDDKTLKLFITLKSIWIWIQTLESSRVSSGWEELDALLWKTVSPETLQLQLQTFETDKYQKNRIVDVL